MAKLNYFLLCESFSLSADNKASIINVFDTFHYDELPAVPLKFTLAISVQVKQRDVQDGKVQIGVEIHKNNEMLFKAQGATEIPEPGNIVSPLDLSGQLAFKDEGDYIAKLILNDATEIGSYKFFVKPKE